MTAVTSDNVVTKDEAPLAFVDLAAQHREVAAEVEEGFARVMANTAFVGGPDVAAFETAWAQYCDIAHAIGVANGTDALEMALRALGIGHGDEVIVPANSFIASAGAVGRVGAKPAFVDCDDEYLLMDPARIAAAITPRTRAIMPVHLYGQIAPMAAVDAAAKQFGLAVVEDAAQSHGARQNGLLQGSWGDAAATSFYPGKNLGAYGDAGAVMTHSAEIANRVAELRSHGSTKRYEHPTLGFNSRLDTVQAVVLNAKLRRLDAWNQARRAAAETYGELLGGIAGVRLPSVLPGNEAVWHLYVIRVPERARVMESLSTAGIPTAIHYPVPLHLTGAFEDLGHHRGDFPVSESACDEILSLPMHPHLTQSQQIRVADALSQALR